jgi:hypothetical protein
MMQNDLALLVTRNNRHSKQVLAGNGNLLPALKIVRLDSE